MQVFPAIGRWISFSGNKFGGVETLKAHIDLGMGNFRPPVEVVVGHYGDRIPALPEMERLQVGHQNPPSRSTSR